MGELLYQDLQGKIMKGIESLDFKDRECNCRGVTTKDPCAYGGECRKAIVVYSLTCKCCGMEYIGNTQRYVKKRTQEHFREVIQLLKTGKKTDTFASHFAKHFEGKDIPSTTDVRDICKIEVIWQGNATSAMKSFRKHNCALCLKERIEIAKKWYSNPKRLINSNLEIYGFCKHRPHFHRYPTSNPSRADESITLEKSPTHSLVEMEFNDSPGAELYCTEITNTATVGTPTEPPRQINL
jgi:hypothetical protein